MSTYSPGNKVTVEFNLALAGEPDWVRVRVEDENGALVASTENGLVSLDVEGTIARVTTLASVNVTTQGRPAHRLVILTYAASDEFAGTRTLETDYALSDSAPLVVPTNSFLGYNQAIARSAEITDIGAFRSAGREERINALRDAWVALVRLRYSINAATDDQNRLRDVPWRQEYIDMEDITLDEFEGLDPKFLKAITRAQIIEANEILAGGGASRRRMEGILSSTIGETSQMFRTGKPVDYPVSPRTLKELRGYVSFAMRLARGA